MSKKKFYYYPILILVIALSLYLLNIRKHGLKEAPIANLVLNYDYDKDGRKDSSLASGNKAFVFLSTPSGYIPALFIKNSSGEWEPLVRKDNFVAIEERSEGYRISAENFDSISRLRPDSILAMSKTIAPDGNSYEVTLSIEAETWDGKTIFVGEYRWINKGEKDSAEVTIPVAFRLNQDSRKSYYFSPGIFYKNNELTPEGAGTDVDTPRLSKLIKDQYYTFLANRPMLPVIANWDKGRMVMLGTVDTIEIGRERVRNSMGWHIADNKIEQRIWSHGYLYNRYIGSDNWTEELDKDTALKTNIGRGESLTHKFYLAFEEGDVWTIYDYYKVFRECYRKGLKRRIYESMKSSFETKLTHIEDWYDQDKGHFLHTAGARDQFIISWVGGTPAGYGMLLMSDLLGKEKLRDWSVKTIDFVADNSLSPSGFSYNWYQDGVWDYQGIGATHPLYRKGIPARIVSESVFYMLKAYQYEIARGEVHANWLRNIESNLDAVVAVWEKNGEFGYEYSDNEVALAQAGTPAGILWIGALALGYEATGNAKYLEVAKSAADYYYSNFLSKGLLYGGELDQDYSPDASSSAHAMAACYTLYEVTGDEVYLTFAKKAADIYSTYVMGHNVFFNPSSTVGQKGWTSLGLSTSGTRNNHITSGCWPGFIEYLVDIYDKTGEVYYLNVAADQYQASLEGYARSEDDIANVPGMGKIKTGYGFDWIVHSDFCGGLAESHFWFGGLRHLGMFHQTYIPALNWIPNQRDYGNVIIDWDAKHTASLDSLTITRASFGEEIRFTGYNTGSNDEVYKFLLKNLPPGEYDVYKDAAKLGSIHVSKKKPNVSFETFQKSRATSVYIIKESCR